MSTTIRRTVIPAAGLGSRLLPLTKATPKEMLPVGGKPVIEHTVRELVASIDFQRYGVPVVKEDLGNGLLRITGLVEKPKPEDARSAYVAIGGYVVNPGIIEELRRQTERWYEHRTGEIYLTDAIKIYASSRGMYGQVIQGQWYDTGNPLDYLTAQFAAALADPEYGPPLRKLAQGPGDPSRI